ncbi:MAG: MATE family efflux transporter [Oscillospiraceae bacterium]|nr:MATE family efflux transporter [Oscillospiraceae bacterium]
MESNRLLFSNRQLTRLIWPLLVEQLLSVLVGMADVLMVSFVGEATVSGVSLVDSVNHLIIQVLFALTAGGTVVCAGSIGAKDMPSARKGCGQLLTVTAAVMLVLAAVLLTAGRGVLHLLFGTVDTAVMNDAVIYMRFTAASFPFLAVYHAVSAAFRANGNSRISMFVSLGMNLLNIAGNALCIFGLGWGVTGVALPTLVSRIAAAAAMGALLQAPKNTLRLDSFRQLRPDRAILRRILSIGVPGSVESALFNLGKVLLQSLVSTLGTASIAAYAVAGNLVTYLYLPGNALGTAITTVAGQCTGAGEPEQARHYTRKLILLDYLMLLPLCAAMILWRGFWVSLYHLSAASAAPAAGLLVTHALGMILWPAALLLPYYFRATGRAAFSMLTAVTAMAVFRVGLACVFVMLLHRDVLWVWYAMLLDWLFRVAVFVPAFAGRRKARGTDPGKEN